MEKHEHLPSVWRNPWFETVYRIGIVIKGIDGAVELIAGLLILIAPKLLHAGLTGLIAELGEHNTRPFQFVAEYVGRVDTQLLHSGLIFLILFLIVHGIVKLGLVYCLLKRIERAYPVALFILVVFLIYQVYVFVTQLSILMAFFTVLDIVIIWLVWNEYQELKTRAKNVVK